MSRKDSSKNYEAVHKIRGARGALYLAAHKETGEMTWGYRKEKDSFYEAMSPACARRSLRLLSDPKRVERLKAKALDDLKKRQEQTPWAYQWVQYIKGGLRNTDASLTFFRSGYLNYRNILFTVTEEEPGKYTHIFSVGCCRVDIDKLAEQVQEHVGWV